MTLSVIIISKNEAHDIEDCLRSVAFADEIIVVDSQSSDDTCEIARRYTPHVHTVPWQGFGPQKNHALDLATGDWVLSLDCDERITEQLQHSILKAIENTSAVGFMLQFRTSYCGRFMRFGDWGHERKLRLFRRDAGRFDGAIVHENIDISGEIQTLKGYVQHYSARSHDEIRAKGEHYAALGAESAFDSGRTATKLTALGRGSFAFIRGYILKGGFLDGRQGLQLARELAALTYRKYELLAQRCRESS